MEKIKDIISNIGGVSTGTWVRLILMIISLINLALTGFGINPLAVDNETLYTAVSVALALIAGLLAYWKNNSFTAAAQAADAFLHNQTPAGEDSTSDATQEAAE